MAESLFLYEWVTGGGMAGREGRLPASLLREGLAMVQAVAADAAAAGVRVTLLRDLGVSAIAAPGAEIMTVDSRSAHDRLFAEQAAAADTTLVIAPETDGALLTAAENAGRAGAQLVSPGSEWVRIASDKQATGLRLSEAGVTIPTTVRLEPDGHLPREFGYPAVVKPIDGAGSQDTHVVATADDRPPAYAWPRLLQTYVAGAPASVAAIGVAGSTPVLLPPCRQRISSDGRLAYLGGQTPLPAGLAERAHALARQALAAMPPLTGYAGVDMVLGDDPTGANDAVLELNPRLTTSFVGLRAACRGGSLVRAMINAANGEEPKLAFDPTPLEFDADGTVYYASV